MFTLDLANVVSQTFSTTLDNDRYIITIYEAAGCIACDISRNEISLINGARIINGDFIIPFSMQGASGNFIFVTQNFELPDYTLFGTTQTFTYMNASEIAAAVGGTTP